MASNSGGLRDGDGDSSDWIELFNAGTVAVDLGGYYLTDNADQLSKWSFPVGTSIAPGATLLVFASDKGTAGPAGELHTNFALSAGGEFLAPGRSRRLVVRSCLFARIPATTDQCILRIIDDVQHHDVGR